MHHAPSEGKPLPRGPRKRGAYRAVEEGENGTPTESTSSPTSITSLPPARAISPARLDLMSGSQVQTGCPDHRILPPPARAASAASAPATWPTPREGTQGVDVGSQAPPQPIPTERSRRGGRPSGRPRSQRTPPRSAPQAAASSSRAANPTCGQPETRSNVGAHAWAWTLGHFPAPMVAAKPTSKVPTRSAGPGSEPPRPASWPKPAPEKWSIV